MSAEFSILVPTYGRPGPLAMCLRSLARLDYPRRGFEVIVVDDGSGIPIEPVVAPYREQLDLKLIRQPNAGPARARNTGAAQATRPFLAFTDDDCRPDSGWLKALAERFSATPENAIGGRTLNALPENPYATASQLLIDYLYAYYNAGGRGPRFFATNNLALPADRFRQLGGFDARFPLAAGEDRDFCDRWLHHGYGLTYAPEAVVYHSHALTWRTFWRQHFHYGRGAFHFHQARARRTGEGIKVEPLSFYFNLLRCPFSRVSPARSPLLATLLAVSQAANLAGFLLSRTKDRAGKEAP